MTAQLERQTLWTRMRSLLERVVTSLDRQSFIEECLDVLIELLGADCAVLMLGRPGPAGQVLAARRGHRDMRAEERSRVAFPVMEEALRLGRSVVITRDAGTPLAATFADSAIGAAIAAPLNPARWRHDRQQHLFGSVYLGFREGAHQVGPVHQEFFEAAVALLSLVLDQRERIEAIREDLRVVQARDSGELRGPTLDEMLRPESMSELRQEIAACLKGSSPVMILGESGTGKTQLATAIARASGRSPVVRATLGSSDDLNTITSELFGHERGAFSGAVSARRGLVDHANGGTLILDEILNLPPHAQQLLLDFTQFGTYRPLGYEGREPKRASVRIIAATNGNIHQAIKDTRFRQDLYFRLAAVPLVVPPLRTRRKDIPELAESFLRRFEPGRTWQLSPAARSLLLSDAFEWAGNIRELEALLRRARDRAVAQRADTEVLNPDHLVRRGDPQFERAFRGVDVDREPSDRQGRDPAIAGDGGGSLAERWARLQRERTALDGVERDLIDTALRGSRGVISHAARALEVARTSLISRMDTLSIDRERYRSGRPPTPERDD